MTPPADDALLRFYRLEGRDARGRTLSEIWTWDDASLESVHDYIQWLFPLSEPSAFNPHAPILTDDTIAAFRAHDDLRERLLRSLTLMLGFYGLALAPGSGGAPRIEPSAAFTVKSRGWLHPGNHNHLRLTRILTSLRLLGFEEHARALYACLAAIARDHPHAVSATTLAYWRNAAASSDDPGRG
jgi:hypothetical protein